MLGIECFPRLAAEHESCQLLHKSVADMPEQNLSSSFTDEFLQQKHNQSEQSIAA